MAERLDAVVERVERLVAALRVAEDLAHRAADDVRRAGAGSAQEHEFDQVAQQWLETGEGASDLVAAVSDALEPVERIRWQLVGGNAPREEPLAVEPPHASATPQSTKTPVERQRELLPEYITSGVRTTPDGSVEIVQSGQEADGTHRHVADHLRNLGFPASPRGRVAMGEHVEGKVAWRQRISGAAHVELVVNNEMCQGVYSCRKLVPLILRPGQTLVVHDPLTTRVFHGRSPL